MKIGILTFHCAENFGAVLQAYALQTFLEEKGHEVQIIDYCPNYICDKYAYFDEYFKTSYKKSKKLFFKLLIYNLLTFSDKKKRKKVFRDFRNNYFKLTDKSYMTYEELNENIKELEFQAIVCGSDQIWNPNVCEGLDSVYFADFQDFLGKKISYAASIGQAIDRRYWKEYQKYVGSLDYVSVREANCKENLKNIRSDIQVVPDPVFLVEKVTWENLIERCPQRGRYILIYLLEESEQAYQLAERLSSENNIKVIQIVINKKVLSKKRNFEIYASCSPIEFISFIKNAEFIVTNSFHATAFSIIFEKEFCVVRHSIRTERMEHLLQKFDMIERLKEPDDLSFEEKFNIDTTKIYEIILEEKQLVNKYFEACGI